MRLIAAICAFLSVSATTATAQTACRQALAIGLDVSGSVDAREYRLQLDGLAAALLHPDVATAILSMPSAPVWLAVFEWSGQQDQHLLLPWTEIGDAATLSAATDRLTRSRRGVTDRTTAIGAAMIRGAGLLAERPTCWKRTLDLSGDGKSNEGPRPRDVRPDPRLAPITVNALVIGADTPATGDRRQVEIGELSAYFRAEVIHGPGAFVEAALGFEDFEAAMVRKLLKELEGLAVSGTAPRSGTDGG